jgi:NAD(P)-dependent dehydrogenase (short-subunit alcohol dehydrogenase family)
MSETSRQTMVLTGCASGIGKCLSRRLLDEGHRVFCTDIDVEPMRAWIDEGGYSADQVGWRKLDVRHPEDWDDTFDEAVQKFGGVDVMMNIAGFLRPAYVCDVDCADVDLHLDVNVKGVILGTRAAAKRMRDQGRGHIVNFGSLASLTPVPGLSLYGASKFAVRGFTLAAAEELRPQGVDVSLVLLDAVKTPMLDLQADYEEAALTFSGRRPLTLEEVEALMIDDVLAGRPLEVTLPKSRGLMARFAGAAPEMTRLISPLLTRLGRRAQGKYDK